MKTQTTNSATSNITTTQKGIWTALVAFLIWGFFPLYFKQLQTFQALEIIGHRVIWTFVVIFVMLIFTNNWQWLTIIRQQPKWLMFTLLSGIMIAINWLTYVWSVNHGRMLEASLGYFIGPLVGVSLSLLVLKERLRQLQQVAVGFAVIGVLIQLFWVGSIPWVSLVLALSFSIYGLMHRYTPLSALSAMFIETALLLPFFMLWFMTGNVASSQLSLWFSPQIFLLMLAGPITLIPLLLFNKATKMVAYSLLSFMNYISPSLVFLLAIFWYHETFNLTTLITFVCIWLGLILFSYDLWQNRKNYQS